MENLIAARLQMAISLGFHIVFAALGIGLPLLMLVAEGLWLRRGERVYLDLARKWAKATGLLFAIGAVSGTALSFELGLLWPPFMQFAGPIIGPAFALEGYAFFLEAIFLGLYLYGWDRLKPRVHWLCGVPVALSGMASGVLVMSANSWMQDPVGYQLQDGRPVNIDPIASLLNPSWAVMAVHLIIASYMATAFMVAAVYAWGMLKGRRDTYHKAALTLALVLGAITAVAQPISGDFSARLVADTQPVKLAAMEFAVPDRAWRASSDRRHPEREYPHGRFRHRDTVWVEFACSPRPQRRNRGPQRRAARPLARYTRRAYFVSGDGWKRSCNPGLRTVVLACTLA